MAVAAGPSRGAFVKGKAQDKSPVEHRILFQTYFKSVGPRTYAAQVKQATNGNHYLILTEGKRDAKTNDLRKISLYIFSEDFPKFFQMVKSTAEFIKSHPVSPEVKERREKFWSKQSVGAGKGAGLEPGGRGAPGSISSVKKTGR